MKSLRYRASLVHLLVSVIVAGSVAVLVFGLWFPWPYGELTGGRALFLLVVCVDVVCGPLLTLVVFNPRKQKAELIRDLSVVALMQLAALGYGVTSMYEARPVFLAYEGDRFRVVTAAEIDYMSMDEAPEELKSLSITGPRLLGVRLLGNSDPEYLSSLALAMEGLHPALRPGRWVPYNSVMDSLRDAMKPLDVLQNRATGEEWREMEKAMEKHNLTFEQTGFLPLVSRYTDAWIVLLSRESAKPVGFSQVDGW